MRKRSKSDTLLLNWGMFIGLPLPRSWVICAKQRDGSLPLLTVRRTQITQVENLITSGTDIIVVQPVDPTYLTDIVDRAHEKGIVMMGHGIAYPSADVNYIDDILASLNICQEY
jgi:hypothetical protein